MQQCPGQDMRFWTPEDVTEIACGNCGHLVEFFKTEGRRRCPECGKRVTNPAVSTGCAQWCEHAQECLGFDPGEVEVETEQVQSIADRLVEAVKKELGSDKKRISHALRVLDHAEALLPEVGGSPRVVIAAALLHDIGIHQAERTYDNAATKLREQDGPPVARCILEELDFEPESVDHVCRIVGSHHSGGDIDTSEFRIVWDADRLVNIEEGELGGGDPQHVEAILHDTFLTAPGRARARELFVDTANGAGAIG